MKDFTVVIDMSWSEEFQIKAKTKAQARIKAWEKFKKRPPKKNFTFLVDEV
jgi:hypothetical protein